MENAIDDAHAKYPDKTLVFVVDGGGPHTVEPSTTIRCSAMSLKEIKEELRRCGKWKDSESCTNAELRTRYINSNIALNQWTIAELTCLQKGALLLYLPLNHPALNPIEQVWRAVKQAYRGIQSDRKNLAGMLDLVKSAMLGKGAFGHVNSAESIARRLKRTETIRRHLIANPSASIPTESQIAKKHFKVSGRVKESGVPKFCRKRARDADDLLQMQMYCHYLNQARLKQQKKGKVTTTMFFV